jgi:hypothetical protein
MSDSAAAAERENAHGEIAQANLCSGERGMMSVTPKDVLRRHEEHHARHETRGHLGNRDIDIHLECMAVCMVNALTLLCQTDVEEGNDLV